MGGWVLAQETVPSRGGGEGHQVNPWPHSSDNTRLCGECLYGPDFNRRRVGAGGGQASPFILAGG